VDLPWSVCFSFVIMLVVAVHFCLMLLHEAWSSLHRRQLHATGLTAS